MPFNAKKLLMVADDPVIGQVEVAFGHAQIINGIEQIGFAHAIVANQAIQPIGKVKLLIFVIFKIR
jgi:hypothetical protein